MAFGGGILVELQRGRKVLLQPLGPFGHQPGQMELRLDISLQRRLAEPARRFGLVQLRVHAGLESEAHDILGIDIADLGEFQLLVERKFLKALSRGRNA